MNYTLNQLRIFLKIAQLSSITKAAEELHLTQPAVSIQLKNFQEQFDTALTEVVGRKLYVTAFGKEVAAIAEKIIEGINTLDYRTFTHKGQLAGKLKISIASTGKYIMPYFLSDFLRLHPGIELSMDVTNKARVIQSLEMNEVDCSLVSVLPDTLATEHIQLIQNKLFPVCNREFEYSETSYDARIFEKLTLIYREQGSATRLVMEKFIKENNLTVFKKIELTSNEAVKQAVVAGLGMSIMPLIGLKNELNNGQLQIIPVRQFPITTHWYLIWLKGKQFSSATQAYLDYLKKEKDRIIKNNFDWFERF
jgi:LysR family transcriptional regulator, low CO2-responsive transcriptional regulator